MLNMVRCKPDLVETLLIRQANKSIATSDTSI